MKIVLFVAHPGLNENAYGAVSRMNRTLLETVKKLPQVDIVDLSKDQDISAHQKLMEGADRIVLQFPVYWFNMPGLAKKWLDDVLSYGWAYGTKFQLEGKEFMFAVTSGQEISSYSASGHVGKTIEEIFMNLKIGATYCKMKPVPHFHVGNPKINDAELEEMAGKYAVHIAKSF